MLIASLVLTVVRFRLKADTQIDQKSGPANAGPNAWSESLLDEMQ